MIKPYVRVCARALTGELGNPPPPSTPSTLEALADRLTRLHWSWRDPETAHVEKHSIASEMRQIARDMRRGRA